MLVLLAATPCIPIFFFTCSGGAWLFGVDEEKCRGGVSEKTSEIAVAKRVKHWSKSD
jgi:hypothetical protein